MMHKLLSVHRYPEFLRLLWWRVVTPFLVRQAGVQIGLDVEFFGTPIISVIAGSNICIGEKSSLCSVSEFTALGVNHPVILRTIRPNATIEIGADTGISGATICAATAVTIGEGCMLGANVMIADTDFHAVDDLNRRHNDNADAINTAPVRIGNNVFLGAGVIVLKTYLL